MRPHHARVRDVVGLCALLAGPLTGQSAAPANPAPAACVSPEHRQFDFWAGDWDVYDVKYPDKVVARARVDPILGGCALREVYDAVSGLQGESFSIFDATRGVWHQSWVTNRGQLLMIEGRLTGDSMILIGLNGEKDGKPIQIRGVWKRVNGGVQETAHTTADGGNTWTPLFDLIFRPHAP